MHCHVVNVTSGQNKVLAVKGYHKEVWLSVKQPVCLALRQQRCSDPSPSHLLQSSVTACCRAHRQPAGQAGGGAAGPPQAAAPQERAPDHAAGHLAAL